MEPNQRFECTGSYTLGTTRFRCTSVHGEVDLREAIVQSCNVYFYRLAEQVGLDRLARLAGDFGLGRRTGIGINSESPGFIPTRSWYERVGRRFRLGYALNTGIGQGDVKVTLTQLALLYGAIANGGTLYVPQLIQRVTGPDGTVVEDFEPRVRRRVHVDPEHLALVIDGLYGVVNDPSGTAYDVRVADGVPVAGKTGTAQVSHRARPDEDPTAGLVLQPRPRVVRGVRAGAEPGGRHHRAGRARRRRRPAGGADRDEHPAGVSRQRGDHGGGRAIAAFGPGHAFAARHALRPGRGVTWPPSGKVSGTTSTGRSS